MMALSLLLKVCVLSALFCLSRMTFTCANFTSSISSLQSMEFVTNATKRLFQERSDDQEILLINSTTETNTANSTGQKPQHAPLPQTRGRSMKSLVSPEFTMDKFISFMTASNNLMNSNTNYPRLDKLTKSFSRLYNSDGMRAVIHFWSLWVNVCYIIDSMANIFRAYETRSLNAIDTNQPQPPNPLEDLQQSLDDANNNIAVVSDLIQQLTRMGEFDDGSTEQQDDDQESYVMQTVKRRLLQDVPQDKQDNGAECNGTDSHEYHEEFEKNGKIYSVRQLVNRRQKKEQRSAVEKNRHFFYAVGHSSNSADNRKDHGALVDVIDDSTRITRIRRSKQFAADKFHKRKSYDKSLISESAFEATSKRSVNIKSGRNNFDVERSTNRSKHYNLQFSFAADRFIYFMAQANNVLNSNTNNVQLNRFTRAFNDLFDSDGLIAFNTFYTLLSSFLTIVDSVANLFRFNEARFRDKIQQQQAARRPSPLEGLQSALNDTNANLAEVAELISISQNGTAARVESGNAKTDKDVRRHQAEHEKKNDLSHLSLEGNNHRVRASSSPNQKSFSHQEINKSYQTKIPEIFSLVATKPHIHIESGGWIPITENSQPLVETNRNFFYYPVNHRRNNQFSSRQHDTHLFPTVNQLYNPKGRYTSSPDTIYTGLTINTLSASRQPMDFSSNATPWNFWQSSIFLRE